MYIIKQLKLVRSKITFRLKEITKIIRPGVWILDGLEVSTNHRLIVFFAGNEVQKNYIANIAFNDNFKELYIGEGCIWYLYYLIHKNIYNCSLAVIEGCFFYRYLCINKRDFYIPIWLESSVDIPLHPTNRSSKTDVQRIRKNKLEYVITKDPDQFHDFYYNMYLPTVRMRHKNRTLEMGYGEMIQKVREGICELLLVTKQGVSIAGGLILFNKRMPQVWSNGIRDADPIHWQEGAIGATCYFSSHYLAERGYKEMHMGLSRCFLRDGVLQYKRKRNSRVIGYGKKRFIIKPLIRSEGVKGFLINNPFAYVKKNKLCGAVFVADAKQYSKENFEQFQKTYYLNGFSEFNIFSFNDVNSKIEKIEL
jgi:hypothetical protein